MSKLFLDDERAPMVAFHYTNDPEYKEEWDIARNCYEFVKYIEWKPMPETISFDHDLAEEHYSKGIASEEDWADYHLTDHIPTGYDCAKFLIEHCDKHNIPLPRIKVHSMNPVGKQNIINLINGFKHFKQRQS